MSCPTIESPMDMRLSATDADILAEAVRRGIVHESRVSSIKRSGEGGRRRFFSVLKDLLACRLDATSSYVTPTTGSTSIQTLATPIDQLSSGVGALSMTPTTQASERNRLGLTNLPQSTPTTESVVQSSLSTSVPLRLPPLATKSGR